MFALGLLHRCFESLHVLMIWLAYIVFGLPILAVLALFIALLCGYEPFPEPYQND